MLPPRGGDSIALYFLFPAMFLICRHVPGQTVAAAENSVSLQKGPAITRADMSNKGHIVTESGEKVCGAFILLW